MASIRDKFFEAWKAREAEQNLPLNMPGASTLEKGVDFGSSIGRGFAQGFSAAPWTLGEGISKLLLTPYDTTLDVMNRRTDEKLMDTLGSRSRRISRNDPDFSSLIDKINKTEGEIRKRQKERTQKVVGQFGSGVKDTVVGGVGTALTLAGAKMVNPKMMGITSGIGGLASGLQGGNIGEGIGRGASQAFKVAGLNRFTSPYINPFVTRAKDFGGPIAGQILGSGAAGIANVAEDELYTRLSEGRVPTNIDRLAAFGMGAALAPFSDYGIKSPEMQARYEKLGGETKLYQDIDGSFIPRAYEAQPKTWEEIQKNPQAITPANPQINQIRPTSQIDMEPNIKQQMATPMSQMEGGYRASSLPPTAGVPQQTHLPGLVTDQALLEKFPTPWSVPADLIGTAQDPHRAARAGLSQVAGAPQPQQVVSQPQPLPPTVQPQYNDFAEVPRQLWGTPQDPWASQRGFIRFGADNTPVQKTGEMPVFRAEDSTSGKADLGKGKYFAFDQDNVSRYGKDIQSYNLDADAKMLDLRDPEALQSFTDKAIKDHQDLFVKGASMDDKVGDAITAAAKEQGYDGILGDDKVFGSVVFNDGLLKQADSVVDMTPSKNLIEHKTQVTRARQAAHQAPTADGNAPLYDVIGKYTGNEIYPDDIYGSDAARLYSAGEPYDGKAINVIQSMKDKPNTRVEVYRAVSKDASTELEPGDWVSLTKEYAKEHGESNLGGNYKIVKKSVMGRDLFTDGNSVHEWGFDPQPKISLEQKSDIGMPMSQKAQDRLGRMLDNRTKVEEPKGVIRGGEALSDQGQTVEMVARERFDIPNLKKIGTGSDRVVFDLGDNKVLKVAKTARGLDQTMNAGDFYAEQAGLIPPIFEKGDNYVVVQKAAKPGKETKQMLKKWESLYHLALQGGNGRPQSAFIDATNEMADSKYADKFPFYDMLNYNPAINDVFAIRNWGEIDGAPIMVDAGSLSGQFLEGEQRGIRNFGEGLASVRKTDNLSDPEFNKIYNRNRVAKEKFGDPKGTNMYGAIPFLAPLGLQNMFNQREEDNRGYIQK